ncbi:RNase A-like domain-containing protein [Roseospira navarrensis]|uniref:Bacterial CdiA-CT RNAse A domain-containing protein n=1 Tax=Roseospira navarrensis TaxID=140058 RepID=A0A7X1ZEX5_9PROT|nr:RNase A-like domain-containing protein [Roseospira navarrensis]MQX37319.1 hypothetical protein [Roseospira navarrensis]
MSEVQDPSAPPILPEAPITDDGLTEDGLTIAVSAIQLAAILDGQTVDAGTSLSNRLMGGLRMLGCALEGAAAIGLSIAPEPTLSTKVLAGVLGAAAADQCQTGVRQIWTGRDIRSLTDQGAARAAELLGASQGTARNIGLAAEILVPLGPALIAGAVRVGAVRAGRISLARHEARDGIIGGGHTIARHVGLTEQQLRQRLAATASYRRPPSRVSTFSTLEIAEDAISRGLRANKPQIQEWSRRARPGDQAKFLFDVRNKVGYGINRDGGEVLEMTKIRIVLKKEEYNGMQHFILTSFPDVF